uniref:Amine oxidase domain-containing protein n=1 Tax=viral metagenome TaxID=1070528 RepID=A0A6C0DSK5_9ZZZZ
MTYDYIIVGGGISGLYSAFRLVYKAAKDKNDTIISPTFNSPTIIPRILLLEKNNARHIGGRMGYYPFHNVDVSIGCGIGRKAKDTLLISLLHDLGVSYKENQIFNQIADNIEYSADIPYIISVLKKRFLEMDGKKCSMTFKEFALPILGKDLYSVFLMTCGYTDFENEDVYETLYYYGMDDNTPGWTGLSISWKDLLASMLEKLDKKIEIKTEAEVVGIDSGSDFTVTLASGSKYSSKKIILATTVNTVRKLLPRFSIYRDIVGQPFLRIYGKFSKECVPLLREHFSMGTMVKGPIHRIIPINIDDGIFLIVYTDNKGALALKPYTDNTKKNRNHLCRLIERTCDLPDKGLFLLDIVSFYWDIGTHYYKPLSSEFIKVYPRFCSQMATKQLMTHILSADKYIYPLIEIKDGVECKYAREQFVYNAQHPMPGMLVVGEMVSRNQGWIEGALESVDAVL